MNEEQRIKTIRKFYTESESDQLVSAAANNVLDLFDWAHDSRNKILHSEHYPMGIGADPSMFYLTERASKRDPSSKYLSVNLETLRATAEHMRDGIVRAAEISIHVRYRGTDLSKLPENLWVYAQDNDFAPFLTIPDN